MRESPPPLHAPRTGGRLAGRARGVLHALCALLALCTAGCDERVLWLLQLGGDLPPTTSTIVVTAALGDEIAAPLTFSNHDRFAIDLPVGSRGTLDYRVTALDSPFQYYMPTSSVNTLADGFGKLEVEGHGTYEATTQLVAGRNLGLLISPGGSREVAALDVNQDGDTDIVVTSAKQNSIYVYEGAGDGTFGSGGSYTLDGYPVRMRLADINGDTYTDLITYYATGTGSEQRYKLCVLINQSAADAVVRFERHDILTLDPGWVINDVVAARFLSAVSTDTIVAAVVGPDGTGALVHVLYDGATGVATELTRTAFTPPLVTLVAGAFLKELQDDGTDLIGFDASGGLVLPSDGRGGFRKAVGAIPLTNVHSVTTARLNGDAYTDLLITRDSLGRAQTEADELHALLGQALGTFAAISFSYILPSGVGLVVPIDANQDGTTDRVVSTNEIRPILGLHTVPGDGTLRAEAPIIQLGRSHGLALGFINQNSVPDIVFSDLLGDTVLVLFDVVN